MIDKPTANSYLPIWLSYLENLHSKSIDLGLARVKAVAEKLDVLNVAPYIITVAGTNGKGTTCHALEMILMAAGYNVGVYSSPHLLRFTERVRINNLESNDKDTVFAFNEIEQIRDDISLTYFEYATLAALYQFKQAKLDVVILEVGLGGRLDATNIIDADLAIITSIDIDHVEYLGDNRENIGREKAGIFKNKSIAIVGEPDIPQSIINTAKAINCPLYAVNHNWTYQCIDDKHWNYISKNHHYQNLPIPSIPLINAVTAIAALTYSPLTISESNIIDGLTNMALIGRLQKIHDLPLVMVDVGHNPHAAGYLQKQLDSLKDKQQNLGKIRIVVGMLKDKDIKSTLSLLHADVWYCASIHNERGATSQLLENVLIQLSNKEIYAFDSVSHAYQQAMKEANKNDIIIVCGSFHTVAEVLANLTVK